MLSERICRQNKYVLYDSIYIKFKKCQLIYSDKIDQWLPRGGGEGMTYSLSGLLQDLTSVYTCQNLPNNNLNVYSLLFVNYNFMSSKKLIIFRATKSL